MTGGGLRRALITGALLLVGAGLVLISYTLQRHGTTAPSEPVVQIRPSATWATLPTRVPSGQSAQPITPDLQPLHRAILVGKTTDAELMWDALQDSSIEQTAEMQLAGARIALLRGDAGAAESRVWEAIGLEPRNAECWSLLGIVLRTEGDAEGAHQALSIAASLDPALSDALFADRWAAAMMQDAGADLARLAEEFAALHPDSPLGPYYHGQALIAIGEPLAAIELLVDAISRQPSSPALVWYALGEAYLARSGYAEAAVTFEVAATLLARGDTSLAQIGAAPLNDLNGKLAVAYVHSARCAEAEDIARRLLTDQPEIETLVEQAVICQTPTPTLTPWILTPWIPTPES